MAKIKESDIDVPRYLDESDVRTLLRLADLCTDSRAKAIKQRGLRSGMGGIVLGIFAAFLRSTVIPAIQEEHERQGKK